MPGEYLRSRSGVLEKEDYKEIFTTHIVTVPRKAGFFYKFDKRAIKKMKKSGVEFGDNVKVMNTPYVIYQSRCETFIRKADYWGRIKIGNNVFLQSSHCYPIPNSTVRLSIVKIAQDKIGQIIIGNNVYLPGTSIVSYERVEIRDNVLIGPGVIIMDSSGHDLYKRGQKGELESLKISPIIIDENAWLGYGAVILKGVRIGKNSVVGINSVVHESVPDNTVVAGNPAKIIKRL